VGGNQGFECPENPTQKGWDVDEEFLVQELRIVVLEYAACFRGSCFGVSVPTSQADSFIVMDLNGLVDL